MAAPNTQIVQATIDALNRRDWDAGVGLLTEDFEFDLSRAVGPLHGIFTRQTIVEFMEEFSEPWEAIRFEADDFIEVGDLVVTPLTDTQTGRQGIEVQVHPSHVWTLRDGKVARVCFYPALEQALAAVEGSG